MYDLIDKNVLVAEIERRLDDLYDYLPDASKVEKGTITISEACNTGKYTALESFRNYIDTLELKDPYITCIQYGSRESAIKAHAEDYSWNIESELFQQLTPEQQKLWRKEIEQAVISGEYSGLNLARDRRYDDTPEVIEIGVDVGSPKGDLGRKTVQVIDADGNISEVTFDKIQKGE